MSSTGNSDIQRILADVMANRPYSHRQNVDPTVVAVVTVEEDMRFLPDTMGALLRQTVLPGVIVIADCASGDNPPVQSQFQVIPAPSGLVSSVPQPKTVTVELVGVKGARSFYHGVAKALHDAQLDSSTARSGCCMTIHGPRTTHASNHCWRRGVTIRLHRCWEPSSWTGRPNTCMTSARMRTGIAWSRWWSTANRIRSSMTAAVTCSR